LYVRDGVDLEPIIHGGGQERGLRSGTENVPGIVGMGKAAELAVKDMPERRGRLTELREELVATVQNETDVTLIGHPDQRLPGYAMMGFPRYSGTDLVQAFADHDVAVSSGSACHSGDRSPSRVLVEMSIDTNLASGAVRFSLGRETTSEDIQYVKDSFGRVLAGAKA
jgi:cysteine desulfurase